MLLIQQNTTNNLYFNLDAYNFSYDNFILLVFTNDMTKVDYPVVIYGKDTGSPLLFAQLIDMQTGTPDSLNYEIKLLNTGYYKYQLYEQLNGTNLDKNDVSVIKPLNFGKAFVSGDKEVVYTEHIDTTDTTNYMYIK